MFVVVTDIDRKDSFEVPSVHDQDPVKTFAADGADPALLLCQGGARFQALVDGTDEEPLRAADRFAAALSFGAFAL